MEDKKFYFVKECPGESFEYDIYWDEQTAIDNHMWFGGNRDYCEINKRLKTAHCKCYRFY